MSGSSFQYFKNSKGQLPVVFLQRGTEPQSEVSAKVHTFYLSIREAEKQVRLAWST